MPTQDELLQALRNADKAGDKAAATRIAQLLQAKGAPSSASPSVPAAAAPAAPETSLVDKNVSVAKGFGKKLLSQASDINSMVPNLIGQMTPENVSRGWENLTTPSKWPGAIAEGVGKAASNATEFLTGLFHPGETPEDLEKWGGRLAVTSENVIPVVSGATRVIGSLGKTGAALDAATEATAGAGREAAGAMRAGIAAEQTAREKAIKGELSLAHAEADTAEQAAKHEAEMEEHATREAAEKERAAGLQAGREKAKVISAFRRQQKEALEGASKQAAESVGLPPSDVTNEAPNGTVGRDYRARMIAAFKNAVTTRSKDPAWENYIKRYGELEDSGNFFISSQPGIKFSKDLEYWENVKLDDKSTPFTRQMQASAKRLRKALSGEIPKDKDGVPVKGEKARPVTMDVVDAELQNLRYLANKNDFVGHSAIAAKNASTLADHLEEAMRAFVGEEYYPRERYRQLSERVNQFSTGVGQRAISRENIDYLKTRRTPFKVDAADLVKDFESSENIKQMRLILGDKQTAELAARHVSNELHGLDAAGARRWLDKQVANGWIKEFPELRNMAENHAGALARAEGKTEGLAREAKARAESISQTRKEIKSAIKEVRSTAERKISAAAEEKAKKIPKIEAKTAETKAASEAKASKQYADLQKEMDGRRKVADSLEALLAGEKPTTMVGKFEANAEKDLIDSGLMTPQQTAALKQQLRALDQANKAVTDSAKLKQALYKALLITGSTAALATGGKKIYDVIQAATP